MGCCIAIAMVIAVVRGAWFKLFPHRRGPESGFAPPAFRPAPGAEAVAFRAPLPATPVSRATAPWTAMLLGAAAVTVAAYAAAIELLAVAGVLHTAAPLSRHALFALLGLAALLGAATCPGRPLPARRSIGVVLTSVGATWTALSLADMHLFGALSGGHHHSGHSASNLFVHGVGVAVLAVGLGRLLRRSTDSFPDESPQCLPVGSHARRQGTDLPVRTP